jgi:Tol biopolymer transport system component/DNA-binding winged helix-turn-helix (wHTH) protein
VARAQGIAIHFHSPRWRSCVGYIRFCPTDICAFDSFQVDLSSNELFRLGVRVPIQEQPLQVLRLLLEAEGRVVTREHLGSALWPKDTFVDFEHGVNTAVKKLRRALEDSAESPRFVETLPKVGYRFMVPVEWTADVGGGNPQPRVVAIAPPRPTAVPSLAVSEKALQNTGSRWRPEYLVIGLLLLAVISGYLLRHRPKIQPDKLTIAPFTTFPGFEIAPSFSPDGNEIVFSWFGYEKEFQFDLYIKQVGQEHVMQLTHHPAAFLASAWSPDGRLIAFMRQADPEGTGIYLISPLGGAERKLASITAYDGWEPLGVSWSPDGKWLAFSKGNSLAKKADSSADHFSIHLVNVETSEERLLPDPSSDCGNTWQPAFSPDGKYLASVCVLAGGVAKVYLQTPDGKQARELKDARSSEGFSGLAWAEDSQSLLYCSDQHLWRVPLAGGKPEMLLFAQDVESVAVASHGNRLAFAQVHHSGNVFQLALAIQTKLTAPATKLISSTRGDAGAHVSRDGKHIAFQSWRSGNPEVWVCDRDSSNPIQLTSFGGPSIGEPRWSPDGRRIVFDLRTDSGIPELYIVDLVGGPPRRFLTGTTEAASPFWSGDGHWIYFNTERPHAIWKAPAEGGAASRLTAEGKDQSEPQEAMDGTRVFFYSGGNVWSASVNGGDERPVPGVPSYVSWVPARSGAYFVDGGPRHFALHYFDTATQHARKIVDFPYLFAMWGSSLAPDGQSILFSGIEHSEADIMLVEGFR